MDKRKFIYFVSDVHLGLRNGDEDGREARFVEFLRGIPAERTSAVFLLGDIWDFWYEYKYVVPKGYIRVFAALDSLMEAGVRVFFFPGNHDVWAYNYFKELGMVVMDQKYATIAMDGQLFCLGHGDGLGPVSRGYRALRWLFHNKLAQWCFSLLHPRMAFALGNRWSHSNRMSHGDKYVFKGESEPLYKFAAALSSEQRVDHFIFGHYHSLYSTELPSGASFNVLDDWFLTSNWLRWDGFKMESFVEEAKIASDEEEARNPSDICEES